jgi:predicted SAM-dependent methyltransferase
MGEYMGLKLDLGNRNRWRTHDGWTTVDLDECDIVHDLRVAPYPFETNSVDEILLSHVIEHVLRADGYTMLRECFRILRPGCWIHIAVPDMDKFITCSVNNDWAAVSDAASKDFNVFLGSAEEAVDSPGRHRYMYNFESLAYMLQFTGFIYIKQIDYSEPHEPSYKQFSLYIDAQKPF